MIEITEFIPDIQFSIFIWLTTSKLNYTFGDDGRVPCVKKGRNKVHNQWPLILQPSFDHQCGWSWWYEFSVHQRVQNRVETHVKELGAKLAEQLIPQWTIPLFSSHHQWWQNCDKLQCGTSQLAIWPDLPRRPILETLLQWGIENSAKKKKCLYTYY